MTPQAIRLEKKGEWAVLNEVSDEAKYTKENCIHCLDRATNIVAKIQAHKSRTRYPGKTDGVVELIATKAAPVYEKASKASKVIGELDENERVYVDSVTPGIDLKDEFAQVTAIERRGKDFFFGFVERAVLRIPE